MNASSASICVSLLHGLVERMRVPSPRQSVGILDVALCERGMASVVCWGGFRRRLRGRGSASANSFFPVNRCTPIIFYGMQWAGASMAPVSGVPFRSVFHHCFGGTLAPAGRAGVLIRYFAISLLVFRLSVLYLCGSRVHACFPVGWAATTVAVDSVADYFPAVISIPV